MSEVRVLPGALRFPPKLSSAPWVRFPELHVGTDPGKEPRSREETELQAHAVSLRLPKAIVLAVVGLAALFALVASTGRADAKAKHHSAVTKGPKGLRFWTPPKKLPSR